MLPNLLRESGRAEHVVTIYSDGGEEKEKVHKKWYEVLRTMVNVNEEAM
jgi:hypothetical protein